MSLQTKHTLSEKLSERDAGKYVPAAQATDAKTIQGLFTQKLKLEDSYALVSQLNSAEYVEKRIAGIEDEIKEKFKGEEELAGLDELVTSLENHITELLTSLGVPINLPQGTSLRHNYKRFVTKDEEVKIEEEFNKAISDPSQINKLQQDIDKLEENIKELTALNADTLNKKFEALLPVVKKWGKFKQLEDQNNGLSKLKENI